MLHHFSLKHVVSRILMVFGLLLVVSCEQQIKPDNYQQQRQFFLAAIEQVQRAGAVLQQKQLSPLDIKQAMLLLDDTMLNANSVEGAFLKWLDHGLYQAFSAYLIKGVEEYRLGVALDDREQQAKGIALLQRWWSVWQLKKPAVFNLLDVQ